MPFYKLGDIKNFIWSRDNFNILQSLLKQIIASLHMAFQQFGFIHNDTHPGNFLIAHTNKTTINYNYNNKIYTLPLLNYKVIIMDFEQHLLSNPNKESIYIFYMGIEQIFLDLEYKLNIIIDNLNNIKEYINLFKKNGILIHDLTDLFNIIDKMNFIKKINISNLTYNPFVF
jgi:hypothetical protein